MASSAGDILKKLIELGSAACLSKGNGFAGNREHPTKSWFEAKTRDF